MSVDMLMARIRRDLKTHGRGIMSVFGGDGEDAYPFTYSIGNYLAGKPELLIVAPLDPRQATMLINMISNNPDVKYEEGELVDIGAAVKFKLLNVTGLAQQSYTFQATYFFEHNQYRVMQIIVPDAEGRFPGDQGCVMPYASWPVLKTN